MIGQSSERKSVAGQIEVKLLVDAGYLRANRVGADEQTKNGPKRPPGQPSAAKMAPKKWISHGSPILGSLRGNSTSNFRF
jgi:hypothetical protein